MTARNDHCGKLEVVAKLICNEELEKRAAWLTAEHERLGEMPLDLYQERHRLYQEIMAAAREKLSPAEYKRLHSAM